MLIIFLFKKRIMIVYGFYQTPIEIEQFLKPLLSVLNGIYDVTNKEEEDFIKNTKFRNKGEVKKSLFFILN